MGWPNFSSNLKMGQASPFEEHLRGWQVKQSRDTPHSDYPKMEKLMNRLIAFRISILQCLSVNIFLHFLIPFPLTSYVTLGIFCSSVFCICKMGIIRVPST